MPVDFTSLVDSDGSPGSGTILDKAELQALLMGALVTNVSTGSVDNAAVVGMAGHTVCVWSGAADVIWTGLAGGVLGQSFTFKNATTTKIASFPHASGSSSAGNRFANFATSAATPVAPGGAITWRYDGTVWQCVAHEQGAWITAAFNAAHFTGNGAMTWTVDAGDVARSRSKLSGREITYSFAVAITTVGGTPNTMLQISNGQWGGFTLAAADYMKAAYANDNGAVVEAYLAGASIVIAVTKTNAANWAAATNATYAYGEFKGEVT